MPRNSSGVYALPQAAYVPNTVISSSSVNANLSDIATALTGSLPVNGSTGMTGQFLSTSGNVGAPGFAFSSDTNTGFYLAGTHQIGWAANGALAATLNSDRSVTWQGGATWGGNGSFTGTLGVAGKASFTSADSMAIANGTTGQRNVTPAAGDLRYNSTLNCVEYWNGTAWIQPGKAPTVQTFLLGTAQTYTPSTGTIRIRVRMCAGGGGGGAQTTNNGVNGTDTSFGAWTAIHGTGGNNSAAGNGNGGFGGANGTGTLIVRYTGGGGGGAMLSGGGMGGVNPFGGSGGNGNTNGFGVSAVANSGAGGGGGGGTAGVFGGTGGGAGEYVEFYVTNPGPLIYTVGSGGNGGAAGVQPGGNGGSGIIIVEEFYV